MHRFRVLGFTILMLPLAIPGCNRSAAKPAAVRPANYPTTLASPKTLGTALLVSDKAPAKYHPIHYVYIMPEEQQRRILSEATGIRVGDSSDDVIRRLGPPLQDDMMSSKEGSRPPLRTMKYFFAKRDIVGYNNYDPCIEIFYDASDKVSSIASSVDGVPDLNFPYR